MGWAVVQDHAFEHIQHVCPETDDAPHILKCDWDVVTGKTTCLCKCKPRIEEDGKLVIHSSYDGREGVEIVNEILNSK